MLLPQTICTRRLGPLEQLEEGRRCQDEAAHIIAAPSFIPVTELRGPGLGKRLCIIRFERLCASPGQEFEVEMCFNPEAVIGLKGCEGVFQGASVTAATRHVISVVCKGTRKVFYELHLVPP